MYLVSAPRRIRKSTFNKRRHSYKVALAVEIKMRAIITNFVVYIVLSSHLFHACKLVEWIETRAPRGRIRILRKKFSTRVLNLITQILNFSILIHQI
jgi:hypothetical protein